MTDPQHNDHTNERWHLSLFWQFTIPIFLLTVIMFGTIFFIDVRVAVNQTKETVYQRDRVFAEILSQAIYDLLNHNEHTVELFADEVAELDLENREMLQQTTKRFSVNSPNFNRFSIINLEGELITDYFPKGTTEEERTSGIGIDVTQRPYWRQVINSQNTVVSPALSSLATGKPISVIVSPVIKNTELKAVALATIHFETITELADTTLGNENADAIILDSFGTPISHPDKTLVENRTSLYNTAPARAIRQDHSGILEAYRPDDENEYSAAFTTVDDYEWMLWVRQNTNQFIDIRNEVLLREGIQTLVIFLLWVMIITGISHLTSRALLNLNNATKRTTEGEWEKIPIEWNYSSEIAEVAQDFNRMIDELKKRRSETKNLNNMKTRFLTIISHIFRTPLNVLSWNVEALREGSKDTDAIPQEYKENIEAIDTATDRMNMTFQNIFDALEIQQKTVQVNLQNTDINELIRSVTDTFDYSAKKHGIDIITTLPKEPVEAYIDTKKIKNALTNILYNGIVYNTNGGKIDVEVKKRKGGVIITVTDDGLGMSKQTLDELFEPFYRNERAEKHYPDGAGLGLYIAKTYIEFHQGSINIESKKGEGTMVEIVIPMRPKFSDL